MEDEYGQTAEDWKREGWIKRAVPGDPPNSGGSANWDWKRHSAQVELYSFSDQIELLDEMIDTEGGGERGLFDIQAEKDRLWAKLLCAEEKLKAIKVPYIDWDKLGESWFLSQSWVASPPSSP